MRTHPERRRVDVGGVDAGLGDERVGVDAKAFDDVVLEQSVDDDDVAPEELLAPGDPLDDGLAVMDDELQVEVRDAHAGVALA